ncbi:hypothetical protein, unlikely [Trypanosoma brucei gambiense DAL972]|uniref:Uncharacterized protein n=1 Tax=Trypanosoma brucei gambiense (strain MHOM/CI/86/DAL972) TaxID=679716 RepID=C9ZZC2_TRYB9|nr:hypothetical protein, unlikely [Trypanosoma brucei gambiense DAL972]CBH14771.1 hypothetical protein, unlikely [Trypanosoma brucei gambiense DAL972]|eukprot:XP_011777037.1 hypothetical protein, unlikely [Trypanosoma brucei gambiense DAL972]
MLFPLVCCFRIILLLLYCYGASFSNILFFLFFTHSLHMIYARTGKKKKSQTQIACLYVYTYNTSCSQIDGVHSRFYTSSFSFSFSFSSLSFSCLRVRVFLQPLLA